eukprot:1643789-Rhodomonas_salina.3
MYSPAARDHRELQHARQHARIRRQRSDLRRISGRDEPNVDLKCLIECKCMKMGWSNDQTAPARDNGFRY